MICMITGGSGSGKSAYAEQRVLEFGLENQIYIATMHPYDEEAFAKIERHQKMRKEKGFTTLECYTSLECISLSEDEKPVILLECMSNLIANELFEEQGAGPNTCEAVLRGIRYLAEHAKHLVIVTNEVFSDGKRYDKTTEHYQQVLGQVNCEVAQLAEEVIEVVYGIPIVLSHRRRVK